MAVPRPENVKRNKRKGLAEKLIKKDKSLFLEDKSLFLHYRCKKSLLFERMVAAIIAFTL